MMTHTEINRLSHSHLAHQLSVSSHPDALTGIYDELINIAVWKRDLSPELKSAVASFVDANPRFQASMTLSPDDAFENVLDELGQTEQNVLIAQDMAQLVDMFCCLFELDRAGFRLAVLTHAMCPKFHADRVPCRLVTTYQGLATQWLGNTAADRTKLGHGCGGLPDHKSGLYAHDHDIQQLDAGDVALLKGELWEGNEGVGLIHRSPGILEPRFLLTLDFSS